MITPKTGFVLPKQVSYDIFEMSQYVSSQSTTIAADAEETLVNNNIKLSNSVPSRLFVFARRPPNTLGVNQGNTFLGIQSISIEMNNKTGLLSQASPQQLWSMSRSNGLEQNYNEWAMRKFGARVLSGGILSIDPAKDLSLNIDETNGSNGSNQLSLTLRVKNNDVVPYDNVQCVVVALYEGVLNVLDGSKFTYQQGVISKSDVLSASKLPTVYESQLSGLHGRGLGKKIRHALKRFAHKTADWVKKGNLKKVLKDGKQVFDTAKMVGEMAGMGRQRKPRKTTKKGRGVTGAGLTAGSLTGGKSLSRNQLLAMLQS